MNWIDNIINQGRQQITNAVNTGINTVQNVGQNVVSGAQQTIENITSGYGDWLGGGTGIQQTGTAPATTPVSTPANVSAAPTGTITPVNTQATTPTTTPTVSAPTQATTPTIAPTTTAPTTTVPEQATAPATPPKATSPTTPTGTTLNEPVTGFDTYEDYLGNNTTNINNMYQNTVQTIDKQSADTLKALDEQLAAGNKYAGEQLDSSLAFNQQIYDQTAANIKALYESGKITAEEARNLILNAAKEAKDLTYASAERQRQEAETSADVARQRAITDANSAYEQNKAGYGAKAEAMGNMGLTGGGYSDWLDSAAYAQNRAETQSARAESDRVKREAKYNEDMTKLQADITETEKKTAAELDYIKTMSELDTTYAANMGEAEQNKLIADQGAQDTYKGQLYDLNAEYKQGVLETQQAADSAKLSAGNDYIKAIMENEGDLAKFRESVAAGDKEAQKVQLALYEQLLKGVSDGTYSKEVAEALANAYGFNEEWKSQISTAGDTYNSEKANAKAEQEQATKMANFTDLLGRVNSGQLTRDEVVEIAKGLGFDETKDATQLALLGAAADRFATGTEEDKKLAKTNSFIALLDSANSGTYNAEQIQELATQLGFDANNPDDKRLIDMLVKGATAFADEKTAAELKADTEYMNSLYVELMTAANSGDLTEEQIRDIAGRFGFEGKDLDNLGNAAKAYADKKALEEELLEKGASADNKNTIIENIANGNLGTDITDADIDKWVKEDILTPEDAEELKTERNEMITEELEYYAKNGYTAEAIDKVEKLVEKGIISKDDDVYQKTYFDVGLYDAQNLNSAESIIKYKNTLDKYKEEGKMSVEDYESLIVYMYALQGGMLDKKSYSVEDILGQTRINIGGKSLVADVHFKPNVEGDIAEVLNGMNGDSPSQNALSMFDGKLYIYRNGNWKNITYKEIIEAYNNALKKQPDISVPKHTKKTTTSSAEGSGGSSGGGSGLNKPVDNHFGLANR